MTLEVTYWSKRKSKGYLWVEVSEQTFQNKERCKHHFIWLISPGQLKIFFWGCFFFQDVWNLKLQSFEKFTICFLGDSYSSALNSCWNLIIETMVETQVYKYRRKNIFVSHILLSYGIWGCIGHLTYCVSWKTHSETWREVTLTIFRILRCLYIQGHLVKNI